MIKNKNSCVNSSNLENTIIKSFIRSEFALKKKKKKN